MRAKSLDINYIDNTIIPKLNQLLVNLHISSLSALAKPISSISAINQRNVEPYEMRREAIGLALLAAH